MINEKSTEKTFYAKGTNGIGHRYFSNQVGFCQMIPGNDQNTSPTNQRTAGSKLERTSKQMCYGFRRHFKSFSGNFLVLIFSPGCLLTYLVKSLVFNATIFE